MGAVWIVSVTALVAGLLMGIAGQRLLTRGERLRQRELRRLLQHMPAVVWTHDAQGRYRLVSDRFVEFFGREAMALFGRAGEADDPLHQRRRALLVHPDDLGALSAKWKACLAQGVPLLSEHRVRRHDAAYRWSLSEVRPYRDERGRIVAWFGSLVDIEELKRAEAVLRASEAETRTLVDTIPAMIWAVGVFDGPVWFNRTLLDYTGYDQPGARDPEGFDPRRAIADLVHPDEVDTVLAALHHGFLAGEDRALKFRFRRADGVFRWVEGRTANRVGPDGKVICQYGLVVDIDDAVRTRAALREMQERLARASQAASLAEVSASIAHEVNQPLASIVAYAHACQSWLSADPPNLEQAHKMTDRVIRDANSAAEVVARIRALFRPAPGVRTPEDLNDLVAEICGLMADHARAAGTSIATDLALGLPRVPVDRVQIQQVLVNLIRNSIEAMCAAGGGPAIEVSSHLDTCGIVIKVRDHGDGVAEPDRLFEAFHSTKPGGMGMGLAISRTIAEAHGGRLWSLPGERRGAAFALALPVMAEVAA